MIKAQDAIAAARSLLGTPYRELDCIGLIKKVIRTSPGGVKGYTTAGTNSLWKSAAASAKYRDLTWRQEGLSGARAGMLAFKRKGADVHHVGIVAERPLCGMQRGGDRESQGAEGGYASSPGGNQLTVIHSSSVKGEVVETALDGSWQLLAVHRYIEAEGSAGDALRGPEGSGGISISPLDPSGLPYPLETTGAAAPGPRDNGDGGTNVRTDGGTEGGDGMERLFRATVTTKSGALNLRDEPGTGGSRIGSLPRGAVVDVLDTSVNAGWWHVQFGGLDGYASSDYLERIEEADSVEMDGETVAQAVEATTLVREDGDGVVTLIGRWRVAQD